MRTSGVKRGSIRVFAAVGLFAVPVLLVGCGTNSTSAPSSATSSGASSATSPGSPSGAPATSAAASSTGSARPQAWVRGTHVTLTNGTGKAVQVGTATGQGDFAPQTTESALASGASVQATDDWKSAQGTSVLIRVVYAKDDVVEMSVMNPGVGTPAIKWRKGYSVYNWSSTLGDVGSATFDENTTQNLTMEGHSVTATRGGDDGDNKNWTLTLNS